MSCKIIYYEQKTMDLKCEDYGYECTFQTKGGMEQVTLDFIDHNLDVHGIEYDSEVSVIFI